MTRSRAAQGAPVMPSWSVGGLFLEALAVRDFDRMVDCFTPRATMRTLIPPA